MKRSFSSGCDAGFASCRDPLNPRAGRGIPPRHVRAFHVHEPSSARQRAFRDRLCVMSCAARGAYRRPCRHERHRRINRSRQAAGGVRPETSGSQRIARNFLVDGGRVRLTLGNLKRLWGSFRAPRVPPADSIRLFVRAADPRLVLTAARHFCRTGTPGSIRRIGEGSFSTPASNF